MTLVRNQDDVMRVIMEEFYYGCKIKNDAVAENDIIFAGIYCERRNRKRCPFRDLVAVVVYCYNAAAEVYI